MTETNNDEPRLPEPGSCWIRAYRLRGETVALHRVEQCWTTAVGDEYVQLADFELLIPLREFLKAHSRIYPVNEDSGDDDRHPHP